MTGVVLIKQKKKTPLQFSKEYKLSYAAMTEEHQKVIDAMITIRDWCMKITKGHVKRRKGKAWPIHTQLMHEVSELGEVYECLRQSKCDVEITEEIIDCIIAGFTTLNIYKIDRLTNMTPKKYDTLLRQCLSNVILRLEKRITDKDYKVE